MRLYIEKVVAEYVLHGLGLEPIVRAQITELIEPKDTFKFQWAISHHYCPSESAGIYIPSKISAETFQEAKDLLFLYMKGFTSIGIEPNPYY